MNIIAPSLPELKQAVDYCCRKSKSPTYLRIGKLRKIIHKFRKRNGSLEKLEE